MDGSTGARVQDVRGAFEDVELHLDGHQVLSCQHQFALGLDELLLQFARITLVVTGLFGGASRFLNQSLVAFHLTIERLHLCHRFAGFRLPALSAAADVVQLLDQRVVAPGRHEAENGHELDKKLLHVGFRGREYTTRYQVSSSSDTAPRLARLEQILAQTTSVSRTDVHAADVHLSSVPAERIRRLTAELADESARHPDEVDALIIRLLLNEYVTAVGHLRAVARMAAARVDGAGLPMREARRALHRHTKSVEGSTPNWLAKTPDN